MPTRLTSTYSTPSSSSTPDPLRPPFDTPERTYKQQYANLYWLRLAVLRGKVKETATGLWEGMAGEWVLRLLMRLEGGGEREGSARRADAGLGE